MQDLKKRSVQQDILVINYSHCPLIFTLILFYKPLGFLIASSNDLILGLTAFCGETEDEEADIGAGEFRSGLGARLGIVSFSGTRSGFEHRSILEGAFFVEEVFEEQQSSSSSVSTSSRRTEGND